MSDKHVVAALQRSVSELELQLREVVRERDEAYEDRRKARQERDLVRSAWEGAESELVSTSQQLKLEREHSARLSRECQERHDELRAEVERVRKEAADAVQAWKDANGYDDLLSSYSTAVNLLRTVAEKQREACARAMLYGWPSIGPDAAATVRATPLVTEGEP